MDNSILYSVEWDSKGGGYVFTRGDDDLRTTAIARWKEPELRAIDLQVAHRVAGRVAGRVTGMTHSIACRIFFLVIHVAIDLIARVKVFHGIFS